MLEALEPRSPTVSQAPRHSAGADPFRAGRPVTKPRLLIVDDDALVCRSLAKAFRRTVDVATAENTSSARALLATNSFDVVLSDFDMPQEDGLTFLRWVAAEYPLMRRVVMTADEPVSVAPSLEDGTVHARLTKPFEVDQAAKALGLTTMRLASLGELHGAFETSLGELPLVQVVLHETPNDEDVRELISWQHRLLETGLRHAVILIIEPTASLGLGQAAAVPKWFSTKAAATERSGLAVVSSSRFERMAMGTANVFQQQWPWRTFGPNELGDAVSWLRATLNETLGTPLSVVR